MKTCFSFYCIINTYGLDSFVTNDAVVLALVCYIVTTANLFPIPIADGIKYLYEKVRPILLPYVISSIDTNDGVSCEGHAEAEVEIPAHTAFSSGIDESSESADGNINDFECETKEDSETSENCSIHKDIVNNSDLIYSTDTKQKRNANSVVENQKLVNTKASLLGSSYQIQCSKAHYMSASESE